MTKSTTSPFPFLKLPREIRDSVYRQLLSTQYTFTHPYTARSWGWPLPFRFTTAILRANKQVSNEASQVLYVENQFIVLRIASRRYTCLKDFPNFTTLLVNQIPHPVLEVTIRDLDMVPLDHRTIQTFIFTIEGFPYFIEQLWMKAEKCNCYNTMSFALSVYNKAPSRQGLLDNHIVRSLDQIPGFAESQIDGDVDNEVVQHVTECMTRGPQLQDVVSTMTGFVTQGDGYAKQKDYGPANWHWTRQSMFHYFCRQYHEAMSQRAPLRTRYSYMEFLEATLPITLRVHLRQQMMALHTKDYQHVADTAIKLLEAVQDLISGTTLNYRVPPVLAAKFWFCKSIRQFGLEGRESRTDCHTLAVLCICKDRRFASKFFSEVSEQLEWARNRYLRQQEDPSKCREDGTSTLMLDIQVTPSGWRSFEEWMELPEEDLGS